ncbi:MAG: CtsR family transcriptional regulator [Tissierellia bacterium]|nr:CtsR family transcriptional regulator [Tissierellia bacterium]
MAKLSNSIEDFLNQLIEEANGALEIQRALIAEQFDCSPSQINYVLTTRFTPYKGYYVESRRGGGGYIRIVKVELKKSEKTLNKFIDVIGNSITKDKSDLLVDELLVQGMITKRENEMIKVALSDRSINCVEERNTMRANILKNILLVVFSWEE